MVVYQSFYAEDEVHYSAFILNYEVKSSVFEYEANTLPLVERRLLKAIVYCLEYLLFILLKSYRRCTVNNAFYFINSTYEHYTQERLTSTNLDFFFKAFSLKVVDPFEIFEITG